MHKGVLRWLLVALLTLPVLSCGRFSGGNSPSVDASVTPSASADSEEALRSAVQTYVSAASSSSESSEVVKAKPYFYKEYETYPNGASDLSIEYLETDSLTTPRVAQVTLEKQRFATKMHRKREDARADSSFFRGTGEETMTLAYRNGRWEKTGSLFVAERLEENINGEWVPVREEVERALAAEDEEAGWFKRAISTITGRY